MRSSRSPQSAVEPLQRQRQMRAALVGRQRVDLVDDHGARGRQHRAARLRAQQHVERLRRRDDDVRRALRAHALALGLRRVAGAHPGADLDVGQPLLAQRLADAGQRRLEVALDVVGQRLERRDVDDLGLVLEAALQPLPHQRVDRRQEGGERLARAGRRGDQHVAPGLDRRPGLGLRRRGRSEAAGEPRGDRGMEQGGGARFVSAGLDWSMPREMTARRLKSKRGANRSRHGRQWRQREPSFPVAVMLAMRKFGNRNDMWDWGVILLLVVGGDHRPVGGRVGGACGGRFPARRGHAGPGIRCRRGASCGRYFFRDGS